MTQYTFNPIDILDTTNAIGIGSGGSLNIGGGASISKDFYVGGNLSISGTTTSFSDNILLINKNPTNSVDTGILFQRHTNDIANSQNYSAVVYSEENDEFQFGYLSSETQRAYASLTDFVKIKTNGINSINNSNTIGNIFTTGGNVGIGTIYPATKLYVYDSVNGEVGHKVHNGNTGSNAYTIFRIGNDVSDAVIFMNGSTRTVDGGGNTTTFRNDTGALRLQSNSGMGIWLSTTGNIGIGTTTPSYPLQIEASVNGDIGNYNYYATGTGTSSGTVAVSLYASARIVATQFNAYSDSRIKKDIVDVDDISALNVLRQIQPKRYNYIDTISKGDRHVWGFIAQQVGDVLEYSTNKITDFIPNVYTRATVSKQNDTSVLTFTNSVVLNTSDDATGRIRLYNFENKHIVVTLKQIISDVCFEVYEDLPQGEYFVYGQEVKDFHTLNKDAIYTITTAAVQEIDAELQKTKTELQQTKVELQETKVELQEMLNNAIQRIHILENK